MDMPEAIEALGALAQETRLRGFRLLVEAAPEGLPAGELARRLGIPANTLSGHLAILVRAGLAAQRREGRVIHCTAELGGLRALLDFLLRDCCGGQPDACAPLLDSLLPLAACCVPPEGNRQ
jgi:DNA-binding transcriptional ArsR family regulator